MPGCTSRAAPGILATEKWSELICSIHLDAQNRSFPNRGVQMEGFQVPRKGKCCRGEEGRSFPGKVCAAGYAWMLPWVRGRLTEDFWTL